MSGDLPPVQEQLRLLERMGALIQRRGHQRFLESPLRESSPEHFPDPWAPDEEGVRAMIRRLLLYAGMGMHRIGLEVTGTPNPVRLIQESGAGALHAAAWFAGIDDQTLFFGCDMAHVHNPDDLVAILAHEVSHAYRHHHGLAGESSPQEESLTDLTTVYLGFGILTANNAGMAQGTLSAARTVGTREKGYLSALEMAYLLAAQVVARGADRKPVAEKLHYSPRRYFLAACKQLGKNRAMLLEQLNVPLSAVSSARLFNAGKTV